ncbi:MAG: sulfite exporter TauE/SafE family protein [Firmicutes bacterium]|jgi:hypothetical protein|nr:sulfite exporter TauE/SafE family protein [Bacillota bacterium]
MIAIILTMFALGIVLGFVGAGGSGFIIALLTVLFGFSIHTASGTALAAMVFSTLSGALSHFRARRVAILPGLTMGAFGALGSFYTSRVAVHIRGSDLKVMIASILFLSAVVMFIRLIFLQRNQSGSHLTLPTRTRSFWIKCGWIGLGAGAISGMFGIGAAPFIQLGLIIGLGVPLALVPGTTMLVIMPTALAGAVGYYHAGDLDLRLLAEVVTGTVLGTFLGAGFTRRLPQGILKTAMILIPIIGGTILLL